LFVPHQIAARVDGQRIAADAQLVAVAGDINDYIGRAVQRLERDVAAAQRNVFTESQR
jgi:hypothetical protein